MSGASCGGISYEDVRTLNAISGGVCVYVPVSLEIRTTHTETCWIFNHIIIVISSSLTISFFPFMNELYLSTKCSIYSTL